MVVGAVALASSAHAENSGAADPALLLGAIPTYQTEAQAHDACGKDAVVWADRYAGYYYTANEKQYAATPDGAFSCRRSAAKGNYWDTDPRSSMTGRPGRSFPYQPLYVGS